MGIVCSQLSTLESVHKDYVSKYLKLNTAEESISLNLIPYFNYRYRSEGS